MHVHGPHDHAVEHGAHGAHGGDSLAQSVALMTAILATLGAVLGYQGSDTQNQAMLYKNEAVLKKTEASNRWSYYQAKSNKQNLAELASITVLTRKRWLFACSAMAATGGGLWIAAYFMH